MAKPIFAGMKSAYSFFMAFGLILGLFSLNACKKPANNGIPAYLRIDSVQVVTTPDQGSASQNISNIWVDVDGVNLGVYSQPVTFPILLSGPTKFFFYAGVKENGIGSTRIIYPFFLPDTVTIDLTKEEVDSFTPEFRYRPQTDFEIYDFDNGNGFTGLGRTDSAEWVFEGNASGIMSLDNINNSGEARLIDAVEDLPLGVPVFIEMDYRNDIQFYFGIEATDVNGTRLSYNKLIITPKEDWNKIYINVSPDITQINADNLTQIRDYNFTIKADLPTDMNLARIFIDNFKIVY
jgi:hypothetical protein